MQTNSTTHPSTAEEIIARIRARRQWLVIGQPPVGPSEPQG